MAKQTVALYTVTSGDRVERARTSLAEALGGADLSPADDAGTFDVAVDAETPEEAVALVREAFARAGTGDDFVIRETTEGREMPDDDPRQGPDVPGAADDGAPAPDPDRSSRIADAASKVAAAASGGSASEAAETAKSAASSAADAVREAATSARETVEDQGIGGAASEYASNVGDVQRDQLKRLAPIAGLLLLLLILRRRMR